MIGAFPCAVKVTTRSAVELTTTEPLIDVTSGACARPSGSVEFQRSSPCTAGCSSQAATSNEPDNTVGRPFTS